MFYHDDRMEPLVEAVREVFKGPFFLIRLKEMMSKVVSILDLIHK